MALQEEFEKQGNKLFRYRSFIPFIFLIMGLLLHAYNEFSQSSWIEQHENFETYYELFCLGVTLFGLFIRIYTVGHTPANTSGRNTAQGQVADELNQTGIYSIVRHPLYVGNFFMWFGISLLTFNLWFNIAFIFIYWVYYERIMFAEEQFLRNKFGEQYLNWANKTPAFIPNFSLFVKPKYPFSWRKVLKKEKNGLAATFIVFSLFYVVGELIDQKPIEFNYLFIGLIATCAIYIVLKILKMKTSLLNEKGR